jgi:hypothetical protein
VASGIREFIALVVAATVTHIMALASARSRAGGRFVAKAPVKRVRRCGRSWNSSTPFPGEVGEEHRSPVGRERVLAGRERERVLAERERVLAGREQEQLVAAVRREQVIVVERQGPVPGGDSR